MISNNDVTPETVNAIAWDVRDGKADPDDVRRVLEYLCNQIEEQKPLSIELREYLKDSIRLFLNGSATSVDQGLGLIRPRKGRTKADKHERRILAAGVLEARIAGKNHQEALDVTAENNQCGKTKVGEAWREFKGEAVPTLLSLRMANDAGPITEPESIAILKIFQKDFDEMKSWLENQPATLTPE
jgi:hypothetical protein